MKFVEHFTLLHKKEGINELRDASIDSIVFDLTHGLKRKYDVSKFKFRPLSFFLFYFLLTLPFYIFEHWLSLLFSLIISFLLILLCIYLTDWKMSKKIQEDLLIENEIMVDKLRKNVKKKHRLRSASASVPTTTAGSPIATIEEFQMGMGSPRDKRYSLPVSPLGVVPELMINSSEISIIGGSDDDEDSTNSKSHRPKTPKTPRTPRTPRSRRSSRGRSKSKSKSKTFKISKKEEIIAQHRSRTEANLRLQMSQNTIGAKQNTTAHRKLSKLDKKRASIKATVKSLRDTVELGDDEKEDKKANIKRDLIYPFSHKIFQYDARQFDDFASYLFDFESTDKGDPLNEDEGGVVPRFIQWYLLIGAFLIIFILFLAQYKTYNDKYTSNKYWYQRCTRSYDNYLNEDNIEDGSCLIRHAVFTTIFTYFGYFLFVSIFVLRIPNISSQRLKLEVEETIKIRFPKKALHKMESIEYTSQQATKRLIDYGEEIGVPVAVIGATIVMFVVHVYVYFDRLV